MKVSKVPVHELHANPRNIRRHNRRNIDAIKSSLLRFGQQKPVVIGPDRIVYAGNGTLEAATELGWATLDCVHTTLTPKDAEAYGIADNRLNELSDWDTAMLQEVITGFDDAALIEVIGFDAPEIDEILSMQPPTEEAAVASRLGAPKKTTPTVRILLHVEDIAEVENAFTATGIANRADALLEICRTYRSSAVGEVS